MSMNSDHLLISCLHDGMLTTDRAAGQRIHRRVPVAWTFELHEEFCPARILAQGWTTYAVG
jgi:hypothetical protein